MQIQILGLATPIVTLLLAGTFFALWHFGKLRRHVLGYGIAFGFSSIGFLITHFLPSDAIYAFHLTHVFYALSSITMIASVCERAGQKLHLGSMVFVYLWSALTLAVAMAFSGDVAWRLIVVNVGYGVMFAMGVTTLLQARRRTLIDNIIIAVITFQALDFLVLPTVTLLFESSIPSEVYRQSVYYSLIGLALGIKGVLTAMVLIGSALVEWSIAFREVSARDPLTQLHNRASFEETVRGQLARAQAEGKPLSLVVADIDHFKRINDHWGHQAGDAIISDFGRLIASMVRPSDTAGRIGGEEFCIAVWNCEADPARRLAERIRQAFAEQQHPCLEKDIFLTASFGVATAHNDECYRELFARADEALYLAKAKSRDRVVMAAERRLVEVVSDDEQPVYPQKRAFS